MTRDVDLSMSMSPEELRVLARMAILEILFGRRLQVNDWQYGPDVSQISLSNRATPIGSPVTCLTGIAGQI